jgi:predicted RNase H-like HicB family nuclease
MSGEIRLAVVVEKGEHNYSAYSPDLPGCVTTGQTVEETIKNMREAVLFHLEGLREDQKSLSSATVATHLMTISTR